MAKFVCSVCGYVYEGEEAPAQCPVCKAPAEKFIKQGDDKTWAAEHVVGVAQGAPEDIMEDLRANFQGECSEVGMYLAMARVISCHLMNSVMDRIQIQCLCTFCKICLTGSCTMLCFNSHLKVLLC